LFANSAAVTPSDSTEQSFSMLFVGATGNLAIEDEKGVQTTFTNVQDGQLLPVSGFKVLATATTATNIVRMW